MGLLLDLQVSQSATFSSCDLQGATSTITPTFNLIPFAISLQPTKSGKWQSDGIDGQTSSLSTSRNAFSMVTADGAKLSANTSSSTVYQGDSFGDSGIIAMSRDRPQDFYGVLTNVSGEPIIVTNWAHGKSLQNRCGRQKEVSRGNPTA